MKTKLFFAVTILCFSIVIGNAQDFKKFRVGLGAGYARPAGEGAKGGVLIYLEPSYRVQDNIAVGLRFETAAMAKGVVDASGNSDFKVSGNASYTINGQYYFSNNDFRPFAGLGMGIYSLASVSIETTTSGNGGSAATAGTKFGFYPRVGFDLGHFVMMLEYNIIPSTKVQYQATTGDIEADVKNSYLGIKLGFFISGGRN